MTVVADVGRASMPWWKEPTKDQWKAWIAAWLGWTLDAFDFTIFLLIMLPISQEFGVPLTAVTAVFAVTLWLRLLGATAAGWMADHMGRRAPLMISILWYSLCNFIAGFSPTFAFLFFFRALLGIGMGAEWPAGAALAMESWPARSRGFMSGVLQGSWGLGFALSALCYGFLYGKDRHQREDCIEAVVADARRQRAGDAREKHAARDYRRAVIGAYRSARPSAFVAETWTRYAPA
jgi:sugar phosphate permease